MLVRDMNSGRLVMLPKQPSAPLGYNDERLGLPILAALPALAAKALPIITSILPMLTSKKSSSPPAAASAPPAAPPALPPMPMPTAQTIAPSPPVDSASATSPLTATTRTTAVDTEVVVAPVPVRQPNGQITIVPMRVRRRRRRRIRTMRVAPPSLQLSEVSKEQVPMMVHDQLSGYVHEVPDTLMGPALGEVVYDGLGNPVGWNPFSAISNAVRGAGNMIRNVVGGAANVASRVMPFNMLPGVNTAMSSLLPGAPAPYPAPGGGSMYPYQPPYGAPRPLPAGWNRPSLPYTGLGPRRMYMRCAVWPGPQGLVPTHAAGMPPGFPGAMPGSMPGAYGVRRRRRHRR